MRRPGGNLESPFLDHDIRTLESETYRPFGGESWEHAEDIDALPELQFETQAGEALDEQLERDEDSEDRYVEEEVSDLAAADTVDEAAAQPPFPQAVRSHLEPLLNAARAADAAQWNTAQHPGKSGIDPATLRARLDRYLDTTRIKDAIRNSAALTHLSSDAGAELSILVHQFQQKIYLPTAQHDGKLGEGTLDALGFVRHRGDRFNRVDALSQSFHAGKDGKGKSAAYERLEAVYGSDSTVFKELGADVTPRTWYCLFVNAPFLGRPFFKGIHVELMRRLRLAEMWLLTLSRYRDMNPVQLGRALGLDEDHHGGRTKDKKSAGLHTLGLAVDIRYKKNPWVAGQADSPNRNKHFREATRNVSRLLTGIEEEITAKWLHSLGSDSTRTTESAHAELEKRNRNFTAYLALQHDQAALRALIQRRKQGPGADNVLEPGETVDHAVARWTDIIKGDRDRLESALAPNRDPADGFLNLHRDLVVALRDHGCLAWGAIDLGPRSSGDMMHFDCRAAGIGRVVVTRKSYNIKTGHPCLPRSARSSTGGEGLSAKSPSAFLGGRVWSFTSKTLPIRVAVFCPKAAASQSDVDMLVFFHGLNRCSPKPKAPPEGFITGGPVKLGEIVNASGRGIILAVPFLDWENLSSNDMAQKGKSKWHRVAEPRNLNGVLAEVLESVRVKSGAGSAPTLNRLALAGHSRAYGVLDALAHAHADPQMSKGALAKLSQVWAFDTTYTCPLDDWKAWLASKPDLAAQIFFRDVELTGPCGNRFREAAKGSNGRLAVTVVTEAHCSVPPKRLPRLLASAGAATSTELETDDEFDDTELESASESPFLDSFVPEAEDPEEFEYEAEPDTAEDEEDEVEAADEDEESDSLQDDLSAEASVTGEADWEGEEVERADMDSFASEVDDPDPASNEYEAVDPASNEYQPGDGFSETELESDFDPSAAELEGETPAAVDAPAVPLGTLVCNIPGRKPFSYSFTPDDLVWTARFINGEAGGRDDAQNRSIIWAMFNRYAFFRNAYPGWGSFGDFVRKYSTPLQPYLKKYGQVEAWVAKCNSTFDNQGCNYQPTTSDVYPGTNVRKGQLKTFLKLQRTPWSDLKESSRRLAARALAGQVDNPIGNASEFGDTAVYFKRKHGRKPTRDEWEKYTREYAARKGFLWRPDQGPYDQYLENVIFVNGAAKKFPPNATTFAGAGASAPPQTKAAPATPAQTTTAAGRQGDPDRELLYDGNTPAPGTVEKRRSFPTSPPITSTQSNRSRMRYDNVINQFAVGVNPRYAQKRNEAGKITSTYCNIFCWDVTRAMGAEVPHWVNKGGEPVKRGEGNEMNANATYNWLQKHGSRYGWNRIADAQEAQARANDGHPVIASYKKPGGIGHLAVVRPGEVTKEGPAIAQAGARNFNNGRWRSIARRGSPVALWGNE